MVTNVSSGARMARLAERLTVRAVTTAKATGKPMMLPDGRGLYLRVGPNSKSWVYRYTEQGKSHDLGLGPFPEIGLADARAKALELRRARLRGFDPLGDRRTTRRRDAAAVAARG